MAKAILSASVIRELLTYDEATGSFYRKVRTAQSHRVGDRADLPAFGSLKGYRTVGLLNCKYLAHRCAWLYVYGSWPSQFIDHINGKKDDNRISNLRDVAAQINLQNKNKLMNTNKSGFQGAQKYGMSNKYRARIQVDGKTINVGVFETAEEAGAAYIAAKRKYHEGCTI